MISLIKIMLFIFFSIFILENTSAQCAMCRAVLESGEQQQMAEGINNGILYLMIIPYLLVGVVVYFIYKKIK